MLCFGLAWTFIDFGEPCSERSVLFGLVSLLMHYNAYMIVDYKSVDSIHVLEYVGA